MAVNPNIPLQVQTPRIGEGIVGLAQVQRQREADRQQQLNQREARESENLAQEQARQEIDQQRLTSVIQGAANILPDLRQGDTTSALRKLEQREQQIRERGGDPSDTQEAIQALQQGNVEELERASEGLVQQGVQMGIIEEPEQPEARSRAGKLVQDFMQGFITPEILDQELQPSQSTAEFERLLNQSNLSEEDKEELRNTRLNRLAQGSGGFSVDVEPDGGIRIQSGRTVSSSRGAVTKGEQVDAREAINTAQNAIEQGSNILKKVQETPGATGLRGTIVENLGGLLGQIPAVGQQLESAVSRTVAGGSPQEVQEIRSEMISQVGSQLSAITGEESGRFTEQERRMAERALKTLGPEASFDQVMAAQKTALRAQVLALTRAHENLGEDPLFNPDNEESINEFGNNLLELGFEEDEATDLIIRLMDRQENPLRGGDGG